jgi:putative SOS response-associated peptidase YedK
LIVEFRIADTFTDSLARLTSDEQKAVKTTAFDLQLNPIGSCPTLGALPPPKRGRRRRPSAAVLSAKNADAKQSAMVGVTTRPDGVSAETLKSCTMIITEPNDFVRAEHDRMPVILEPNNFEPWLAGKAGVELLKPAANDVLQKWPVSKRVNKIGNDEDATLIDRIELA